MNQRDEEFVHIGVNADISYFVTIEDETLEAAFKYLESAESRSNLENVISVDNFASIVDSVDDMSVIPEDKSESDKFYVRNNSSRTIFGFKLSELRSTFVWMVVGGAIGFSPILQSKTSYLALSILVPGGLYAAGKLLIAGKIKVPGFPSRLPRDLANKVGSYRFEIAGSGFIQMFIDGSDIEEAKEKALAIFSLGPKFSEEPITLSHYISLSELKAIYLLREDTEIRSTENLIPLTKRLFEHSLLKYKLLGAGVGAGMVSIPIALVNYFL